MSMTPQDIQNQKFNTKFRGFDVDEVDSFLEEVAENFLALIQENKKLKTKIEALEKNHEEFLNEEKSFKAAMISAQKIADEIKIKSEKEADQILAQAQNEIEEKQNTANNELLMTEKKLEELRNMKIQVQKDLKATLMAYLNQLDEDAYPVDRKAEPSLAPDPHDNTTEVSEPALMEDENLNEETLTELFDEKAQPESIESGSSMSATEIDSREESDETVAKGDNGFDETLAELFQDSELTAPPNYQETDGTITEDDLSDLYQAMELPETLGQDQIPESALEELSEDLLFSDEESVSGDDEPVFTLKEEEEEELKNR